MYTHFKAVARLLGMAWKAPLKAFLFRHFASSCKGSLCGNRLQDLALTSGVSQRCLLQLGPQNASSDSGAHSSFIRILSSISPVQAETKGFLVINMTARLTALQFEIGSSPSRTCKLTATCDFMRCLEISALSQSSGPSSPCTAWYQNPLRRD